MTQTVKSFIEKHITYIEKSDFDGLYQEMGDLNIDEQEELSKIFLKSRIIPAVSEDDQFNIVHFWAKHADADPSQFVQDGLGTSYINVVYSTVLDELSLQGLFDEYIEDRYYDALRFMRDGAVISWSAKEESRTIYDAAAYSNSPKQFLDTIYTYLENKAEQLSN